MFSKFWYWVRYVCLQTNFFVFIISLQKITMLFCFSYFFFYFWIIVSVEYWKKSQNFIFLNEKFTKIFVTQLFYFIFWGSPISVQFEFTFFWKAKKNGTWLGYTEEYSTKKALWKNVMILEKEVWYSWVKKTEADCSAKVIKKRL